MNDGLDSLLEEIPDWTASQGEELMDSEDESAEQTSKEGIPCLLSTWSK